MLDWFAVLVLASILLACEAARHLPWVLSAIPLQAIALAVALVHGASTQPGRGWSNLAIVIGWYALRFLAGEAVRIVRRSGERPDLGFMVAGAVIALPAGIVAALTW